MHTQSDSFIKLSKNVKYLGVNFDNSLSLSTHINKLSSQCYLQLKNINSIRKYLSQSQCETLVNAAITSRLDYCNALYFGLEKTKCLNKLQRIQDCASKLILRRGRRQGLPASQRLHLLHWLSIEKRITLKILVLVFKSSLGLGPILISSLLIPFFHHDSLDNHKYDTRFSTTLTCYGKRVFSYVAPRL